MDSYRAPAGDGLVYYRLSQSPIQDGRFALGPPPTPLCYTRLPGYPLFLAHVAVRRPASLAEHLPHGHPPERGARRRHGAAAVPSYRLTKSLATFLGVLALWLAARAAGRGRLRGAALAGAVTGGAVLVRLDMLSLVPVAALALWTLGAPPRRRLRALALHGACAAAAVAPWGIRNLARFGSSHLLAVPWAGPRGEPMPLEPWRWIYSWSAGRPEDAYPIYLLANSYPLPPERAQVLLPAMYDEAERLRTAALFARYNRERLSPAVRAEFQALARDRARRAPLRHHLLLPLGRLRALWSPLPEAELPMRSRLLDLPARRHLFAYWEWGLFALAGVGALLCVRRGDIRALLLLGGSAAARSLLLPIAHPVPNARYLVEAFPGLIGLAALALRGLGHARRAWRVQVGPVSSAAPQQTPPSR